MQADAWGFFRLAVLGFVRILAPSGESAPRRPLSGSGARFGIGRNGPFCVPKEVRLCYRSVICR